MRRIIFFVSFFFVLIQSTPAQTSDSNHRADWFREAKFGMFVHWGLYSLLEGSYKGKTLPDTSWEHGNSWYAEWIQQRLRIPKEEYRALVKKFNPVNFDADSWIREAANAGMKYFVITAKHHDGFALWDSKVSTYDLGSTDYKGDLLGDLVKACKKYGLKYGFYYSHCEDWDHPGGATPFWTPQKTDAEFQQYWTEKCLPQVTELLERYHPDLMWFDTWGDEQEKIFISDKRRDELIALVRKLSPKTLINGRISWLNPGNEIDFLEMMDNSYPSSVQTRPWQTPATMQESWAYHAKDFHWKSSQQMIRFLISNVSLGGNYLLNIGPKGDGSLPPMAVRRLREMGGWMVANSEAVYGAEHSSLTVPAGIALTQKKSAEATILYAALLQNFPNKITLPVKADQVSSCRVLETGQDVKYMAGDNGDLVMLAPEQGWVECDVPVLKVTLRKN